MSEFPTETSCSENFFSSVLVALLAVGALAFGGLAVSGCDGGADSQTLASVQQTVVYGSDDRDDVYAHDDPLWQARALQSTVALMSVGDIDMSAPNDVRFNAPTLQQSYDLCPGERFPDQPTAAFCSGTLIGPDLVLTAGHCVTRQSECSSTAFVFRYAMASANSLETVTVDDVFYCSGIVSRVETSTVDYAVLRVDRAATPRFTPAPVEKDAIAVPNGAGLVMIGCPSGLPFKIEDGGTVRDNRSQALDYFVANTDSFGGNSGSGVYADASGALVGILVRGETDYIYDYYYGCYRVNVCSNTGCSGEDSTYAFRAVEALCAAAPTDPLCQSGPYCGDGSCDAPETTADCPEDCGTACGDGVCNGAEVNATCPADCPANVCGDGVCDGVAFGEDCGTCVADCECGGRACSKVCCGDGVCSRDESRKGLCPMDCLASWCGDGACDADEATTSCPQDCGTQCGDGVCNGDESEASCADDCGGGGTGDCGDGVCAGWQLGEDCRTCALDCDCGGKDCSKVCCGDGVCSRDEGRKGFCPADCP